MEPTEPQIIPSKEQDKPVPSIEEVEQAILLLRSDQDFFIDYHIDEAADEAIEILKASRSRWAVMPLLELLVKYPGGPISYSYRMSHRVKGALLDIGEPAVLPLTEALLTGGKTMRRNAVQLLGRLQDERAHTLLIRSLKDQDIYVRLGAVFAVSGFPPEKGLPLLIDALQDENPNVRVAIVNSLSHERYREERTTTALVEMVKDRHPDVRCNAVEALNVHGDARAIPLLQNAMQDNEERIRVTAIVASSIRTEPRFIPQYLCALKDREQHVRNLAGKALVAFGDREALVSALLKSDGLSASDKLGTLEVLGRTEVNIDLPQNGMHQNQVLDYRFSSVVEYFQLLREEGIAPEFEQALQEVEGEIKARQDRRQLLRGSESDLPDGNEELLRAHNGVDSSPSEELLRASDPPRAQNTARPSWLKRLLGQK